MDENRIILLVADYGQTVSEHGRHNFFCGLTAVNAVYFKKWDCIILKKDKNSNELHEINWIKTLAVLQRSNSIFINLKGCNEYGIVDSKDKYRLEEKIIDDLYSYRDKKGKRIVSCAIRNKK